MVASNGVWGKFVDCPVDGCEHTCRRNNMGTHLLGSHKWEREQAWATARELPLSTRREQSPTPAVAVAPPPAPLLNYEHRMVELVDCPQGCGAVTKRKRLYQHLEGVHKVEHRAALRAGHNAPASTATQTARGTGKPGRKPGGRAGTRNKATLPAVIVGHKGMQGVDFGEIAPSDIAIAVVQSQVNGMMPTVLLPDVVLYVDHTRELIGKLRAV